MEAENLTSESTFFGYSSGGGAAAQVKGQELNKTSYKMVTFTFKRYTYFLLFSPPSLSLLFSFKFGHYMQTMIIFTSS